MEGRNVALVLSNKQHKQVKDEREIDMERKEDNIRAQSKVGSSSSFHHFSLSFGFELMPIHVVRSLL